VLPPFGLPINLAPLLDFLVDLVALREAFNPFLLTSIPPNLSRLLQPSPTGDAFALFSPYSLAPVYAYFK